VLIVTDKDVVIHVRAYGSRTAAQKGLFKYMQEQQDYHGRKGLRAVREWIKKHSKQLDFDIIQQDIMGTAG